ncbi:MAG: hypothetical protein KF745_09605 [Phycisphaeraceae bacterium]|nr:hypothetical protein [Phycisphaeraceae bacterium]
MLQFVLTLALVVAPPPPLAGPSTTPSEDPAPRPTIVVHDFAGRIVPPEMPAEIAAARLLPLDEEAAASIRAIIDRRAAAIDEFVADNIDLLTRLNSAGAAGDKLDQLDLASEAYARLRPVREATGGRSLQAAIRAALPPDQRAEYDGILRDYWAAVAASAVARPGPDGKVKSRFEAVAAAKLESFGQEIGRAFERMLKSGDLVYTIVTKDLNLTESQAAKIRTLVGEFVDEHGENADKKLYGWLFLQVAAELDRTQRIQLIRTLKSLG